LNVMKSSFFSCQSSL